MEEDNEKKIRHLKYFLSILVFMVFGFWVGLGIRGYGPWLLEHDFIVKFGIVLTGLIGFYLLIFWISPNKK